MHLTNPDSGCTDPRDAETLAALAAADTAEQRAEALSSLLLLLGVAACALLNAYSLGYLSCTNRYLRAALRAVGCAPEIVR